MGEQEHPAVPEPAPAPPPGTTSPITAPATAGPGPRRGRAVRRALTSRAAGWVVAAVLAGAVTALSVVLATGATSPSVVAVRGPFRAMGPVLFGPGGVPFVPPGAVRRGVVAPVPPGAGWVEVGPAGRMQVSVGPGGEVIQRVAPFPLLPGLPPGVKFTGQFRTPFGQVAAGTVGTVSPPGFTITMGGQTVTVVEQPSTVYRKAGSPAAASAVTRGARVAVLGTQSGSKITAIVVAVLP